ncbi:MAG: hypothetical protein Fur0010_07650 [Bdellovibrio sp.]
MSFIISLFMALSVFANTGAPRINNYFSYDDKVIDCTDYEFKNYVLPQVKNIATEFYLFLRKLDPLNNEIINLKLDIQNLYYSWDDLIEPCSKQMDQCQIGLSSFYKQAGSIDKRITSLQAQQLLAGLTDNFMIDNRLNLTHILYELANLNYRLVHQIEAMLVKKSSQQENFATELKFDLQPIIQEMKLTSELMLTSLLNEQLRDSVQFVYMNYIKLLEDFVIRKKDKIYMITRLEETNIAWNTFHMKITKGHQGANVPNQNIITGIHSRWVGILKVILDK